MSDVSKTKELIVEARAYCVNSSECERAIAGLVGRLADALEAATRVPVQGEPNDDREAVARAIAPDDWRLADAPQYAHLPQGARDSLTRQSLEAADRVIASRATVPDAASAAIERVRLLAHQHRSVEQHNVMVPLSEIGDLIREPSSADYLAALDGAPEPEWEEVVQYGNLTSLGFIQEIRGRNYAMHKRIVRFGPALPVDGESDH